MKVRRLAAGAAISLLVACGSDPAPEAGIDTTLADEVDIEAEQIAEIDETEDYAPMDYEDDYAGVEDSSPEPSYRERRSAPDPRSDRSLRNKALVDSAMADTESYQDQAVQWREPKGSEPRGNPGNWATGNDYPSAALREQREGTTAFRVNVSSSGTVTNCLVTRSSGYADLDEATCKNIQRRARFRPATDSSGQEVEDTWSSQVRWQIPD